MEKPYRVPNPLKMPAAALVHDYKLLCYVRYNDRPWDRQYYPRCMRAATRLLKKTRGDFGLAQECLRGLAGRFRAAGLSWTMGTVVSFSIEWLAHREKAEHKREAVAMFGKRGEGSALAQVDPMKVLEAMMR